MGGVGDGGAVKEGGDRLTWAGNPTRPVQLWRGRSAKNKRWGVGGERVGLLLLTKQQTLNGHTRTQTHTHTHACTHTCAA